MKLSYYNSNINIIRLEVKSQAKQYNKFNKKIFSINKNNISYRLEWKLRILDNKFNKYSTFRTFIIKFKHTIINIRKFLIIYHIKRILCITKSKNNIK